MAATSRLQLGRVAQGLTSRCSSRSSSSKGVCSMENTSALPHTNRSFPSSKGASSCIRLAPARWCTSRCSSRSSSSKGVCSMENTSALPHTNRSFPSSKGASSCIRLAPARWCSPYKVEGTHFVQSRSAHKVSAMQQYEGRVGSEREASTSGAKYFGTDRRPIVLFDGVCNFCNGGVNFMLDNDPEGKLRFAALQSEAGRALLGRAGRAPEDISSIVLIEPEKSYVYSEAILRIAQYLPGPLGVVGSVGLFSPGLVRDTFYRLVAQNRYNILGKRDQCRLGDERFQDRFVS